MCLYVCCIYFQFSSSLSSKNRYCPLDFSLALSGSLCVHSEVSFRMSNPYTLVVWLPFVLFLFCQPPFPLSVSCSVLLLILMLFIPLLISSLLLSSIHLLSIPPWCVPLASLSSLLITPFPSPGSSLTSSCASSYQRRWLRSQTTSLENGVFPRWWDAYNHSLHTTVQGTCSNTFYTEYALKIIDLH